MKITLTRGNKIVHEMTTREGTMKREKRNYGSTLRVSLERVAMPMETKVEELIDNVPTIEEEKTFERKPSSSRVINVSLKDAQKEEPKAKVEVQTPVRELSVSLKGDSSIVTSPKVSVGIERTTVETTTEIIMDTTNRVPATEIYEDGEEAVEEVKVEKVETKNKNVVVKGGTSKLNIDPNKLKEAMMRSEEEEDYSNHSGVSDNEMEAFYNAMGMEEEVEEVPEQEHTVKIKKKSSYHYDKSLEEF